VIETGDGIARVSGLPRTMANEILEFRRAARRRFNLDETEIGCIIFGEAAGIEEGIRSSRRPHLVVPVGDGFLGRVVDGSSPDRRQGAIVAEADRALELQAPNVVSRQGVKERSTPGSPRSTR